MSTTERLSTAARAYLVSVTIAGLLASLYSLSVLVSGPVQAPWFILAILTLLSGSFTVRIPTIPARLSVSETFVFAAVLMYGPAAATVIVVLDTLVISFWLGRRANPPARLFFNVAAPAAAIWFSSQAFFKVTGVQPLVVHQQPIISLVLPLLGLAILYFLLNSWLVAFAVAFQKRQSAFSIWRNNFLWLSLNYFNGASVAALLVPYLLQLQSAVVAIIGILLPILSISYLTLRTALGRVEDANKHLGELNRLYISTIETLAMAIDAKDQITHGHIRRVQQYAVGLARHLGVTDRSLISAIEAASLLHDMGKLAIPEYILNKPGKLTPAEFEKMKAHASVGADILSAIEFPYPVVPIVRHHHENWDGTGYPAGLMGAEIPIGARILSVVDCFDALTSDRPYRPKLPDAEAIRILLDRRGSMYDPLVVDAFINVHQDLVAASIESEGEIRAGLTALSRVSTGESSQPESRFGVISSSTEEMLVLYDLAKNLTPTLSVEEAAEVVATHLRRVLPTATYVFYVHDPVRDELVATYATGEARAHFEGLRIPRGQRLSGWVAANHQTIVNSDPVLDLGDISRTLKPRLFSCMATPLAVNNQLVGVLSLYSNTKDAFHEDHRRILEVVAKQVAQSIRSGLNTQAGDRLPRVGSTLPRGAKLDTRLSKNLVTMSSDINLAILLVSLRSPDGGIRPDSDANRVQVEVLLQAIRRELRGPDVLFRYRDDEFIVLLTRTEQKAAEAVGRRILAGLAADAESMGQNEVPSVTVAVASAPEDGANMDALVSAARQRQSPAHASQSPTSIH